MPLQYFIDEEDQHRFRIRGDNGEIMATSEGYSTISNARRGYRDLIFVIENMESEHEEDTSRAPSGSGEDAKSPTEADTQEAPIESQRPKEAERGNEAEGEETSHTTDDKAAGDNSTSLEGGCDEDSR